jgi:tetratricopeptide (TPR) repeat protein
VIDLNVVACDGTGKQLARAQIEANSKEGVLPSLSRASEKLRLKLGESLPTVQKFGVPIQASTSSLEALQNYSKGMKTFNEQGEVPSIPFLKRAIEIDPNFSVAYAALAAAYANLGQQSQAEKYATKAYELRDRATELEKLRITAFYFASRGELDKEIATYQLWTSIYPRDWAAHNNLGYVYANSMGDYSKALAEFQEALRLAPDKLSTYEDLGLTYMNLNRLNDAKAVFEKALANKLDGGALRQDFYLLAFLLGDTALMAQQVEWCSGKPGVEDTIFSMESDTEAYYGRFSKARERTRQAIDSAIRNKDIDSAVSWRVNSALREAEVGNSDSAKLNATESLKISAGRVVKMRTALALARGGEGKVAKTLAEETQKSNESSLMLRVYWLPTVNAASELSVGDSINALISLESPAPYELRQAGNLYPIYLRGQAYLMAQNGPAAAAEFQNILSHRGIVLNFVIGALTHLQLGRAYALEGNPVKARDAYQDFLSLWKDADSDIPIYKQAKAEYAKLQ